MFVVGLGLLLLGLVALEVHLLSLKRRHDA